MLEHLLPQSLTFLMKEGSEASVFGESVPIACGEAKAILGYSTVTQLGDVLIPILTVDQTALSGTRRIFQAIAAYQAIMRDFVDGVWGDVFPSLTRDVPSWESQWALPDNGLNDADRRTRLDAQWKALGGQNPAYLQATMQAHGFDVYIYEWWESENPYVPRTPSVYLSDDGSKAFIVACDEALAECGEAAAQAGETAGPRGTILVNPGIGITYLVPVDPVRWRYILYWAGPTFPDFATVPNSRRAEFEDLLLRICPGQQWLGLLVDYS